MTLIRRGSSTRERPFRTWVRAVATVVQHTPAAANDVGVDTAAADFGLLIVPRLIQPTAKNSVRANESVGPASDGCGDHRKPHRRTARVCGVDQWCTDRGVICPAALRVMSTAELVIAQANDHFNGNTLSHVNERKY